MVLLYLCVSSECANVSYNVITLINNTQSTAELKWQFINMFPVKGKPAENVQMTRVKIRSHFNHRAFSVFTCVSVSVLTWKLREGSVSMETSTEKGSHCCIQFTVKICLTQCPNQAWCDKGCIHTASLSVQLWFSAQIRFLCVSVHIMFLNVANIRFECERVNVIWPARKNNNKEPCSTLS